MTETRTTPDPGEVPQATPAAPDLVCWLWAAFTPYRGRLNAAGIARQLGTVSASTIRRWIAAADGTTIEPALRATLAQRAILRGRGTYLWPDLDHASRYRTDNEAANARTAFSAIEAGHYPDAWDTNGTMDDHQVLLLWIPTAHVYRVAVLRSMAQRARLERDTELVQLVHVPNKYAGLVIKHRLYERIADHRCIAPAGLVPRGRTDTWREDGGAPRLLTTARRAIR